MRDYADMLDDALYELHRDFITDSDGLLTDEFEGVILAESLRMLGRACADPQRPTEQVLEAVMRFQDDCAAAADRHARMHADERVRQMEENER